MHDEKLFELNALQTLLQSVAIVVESNTIEEVLQNCFYVGGDSDTLGCIAANLASSLYPMPADLWDYSYETIQKHEELKILVDHFHTTYWNK